MPINIIIILLSIIILYSIVLYCVSYLYLSPLSGERPLMQSINCPCKDFSSVFLTMAKCLVGKDVTCVITNNESLPEQLGISVFTGGKSFVLPFNQHILHARNDQ